ncbi:MAG TPA: PadR family transcriptional regulator [Ferrovibrio sp.]|uniref:PadR family transcriptional regulator n=1 Tax=Ferrovibrio sp. TaxID=1917215 RepID=UPI002ED5A767
MHSHFKAALREHLEHKMMHRRRGRHGFGPGGFAAGLFGEAGFGGRGFRASRLVSAEDLQLLILALLAEKPSHGYELIKALEERSHGFYAPSPGVIYPALTYLEEIGYATVTAAGAKKLYSITEAGLAHLAERRAQADAMLAELARIGERMARAKQFFAWGEEVDHAPAGEMNSLRDVRHALKRILYDKAEAAPEEQRRVIDILARAIKEIRG